MKIKNVNKMKAWNYAFDRILDNNASAAEDVDEESESPRDKLFKPFVKWNICKESFSKNS